MEILGMMEVIPGIRAAVDENFGLEEFTTAIPVSGIRRVTTPPA
jgi:hypothetical protein